MAQVLATPKVEELLTDKLNVNLTHLSMLSKANLNSKIPELLNSSKKAHKDYIGRLNNDDTKTFTNKRLLVTKHANSQINHIFRTLDSERKFFHDTQKRLESVVTESITLDNTTKILLAQSMAAVLVNKTWLEVVNLMDAGDAETIRAMSLPTMKMQFDLHSNADRQVIVQDMAERVFVKADHEKLVNARDADNAYTQMGDGLMVQLTENDKAVKDIESNIVDDAA